MGDWDLEMPSLSTRKLNNNQCFGRRTLTKIDGVQLCMIN